MHMHTHALCPPQNMYLNFGDIGANIKELVDRYQEKSQSQAKVETIADMKVRRHVLYAVCVRVHTQACAVEGS